MCDLKINIRLFYWHLQIGCNWKVKITYNNVHKGRLKENGFFSVYEWRPFEKARWHDNAN